MTHGINNDSQGTPGMIRSQHAGDPEMAELIDLFVGELPQRAESVLEAWRSRELHTLQRLAHQLKGSCAGYGFPTIGQAAERVENSLRLRGPAEVRLEDLAADIKELIALCHRAAPVGGA